MFLMEKLNTINNAVFVNINYLKTTTLKTAPVKIVTIHVQHMNMKMVLVVCVDTNTIITHLKIVCAQFVVMNMKLKAYQKISYALYAECLLKFLKKKKKNRRFNLWNKKELGYKFKCSAILCEIFAECYTQNYVSKSQNPKIHSSVEYLLKNYKKSDLSIRELADRSFMSEVYFRKLFKEEYGVSPQKYIIDLRIQNAVGLISAGYYSLKEVAYMSGYNDYKYFSVEFKKAMGVSPSKYLYNYK